MRRQKRRRIAGDTVSASRKIMNVQIKVGNGKNMNVQIKISEISEPSEPWTLCGPIGYLVREGARAGCGNGVMRSWLRVAAAGECEQAGDQAQSC